MKKILAYGLVGGLLLLPFSALAINPPAPHDNASGVACSSCHTTHRDAASMSGSDYYNNVCLSCHRPGDAKGGTKPLALADAANPNLFKGYTAATPKPNYQTSHRWNGFLSSTSAGAQAPQTPELAAKLAAAGNQLACIVCHNQHDNSNGKFLRAANDTDQLCRDCHRDRDKTTHVDGSHPVLIGYTSTVRTHPAGYRPTPLNANPANPSSAVQIKNGLVVCSSCHGTHYSDSRSSTLDSGANFANLSSGDGNLLRTERRGEMVNSTAGDFLNLCSNCHQGKYSHHDTVSTTPRRQNVQCTDCHGAHVADPSDPAAANLFLIKRDLGGKKVYFNTAAPNLYYASNDPQKPGVCQACHDIPTGSGYPDEHTSLNGCASCHSHNTPLANGGSFGLATGCQSCHGYPPEANTVGGPTGYAAGSPFVAEATGGHFEHADTLQYARKCVECHRGNRHNQGNFADVFNLGADGRVVTGPILSRYSSRLQPVYNPATLTCDNVYCHSNGAPRQPGTLVAVTTPSWDSAKGGGKGSIAGQPNECQFCHNQVSLPSSSHAKHIASRFPCETCHANTAIDSSAIRNKTIHVNGQKDVIFSGSAAAGTWDTANATCANLYCHSNGQETPVYAATPVWGSGNTICTSCHGSRNSTSGQLSARHYAHLNFTSNVGRPLHCTSCHAATAGSDSTIANPPNHANGKVNIRFDERLNPSSSNPTYGGTSATGANGAAISTSTVGGTCTNTYCHSGGTVGNANSPAWGSGTAISCSGCHGNGAGKAHPVYVGINSHIQHVENAGYGCDYCHVNTVANNSVPPTKVQYQPYSAHINRKIDVVFKLNGGATGSFNPTTHSCATTYCHGASSPAWGATGTLNCAGCHGANNATLPGAHGIHYAAATLATKFRNLSGNVSSVNVYRFTCSTCHDPATATHAGGPAQTAAPVGAAEVAFAPLAVKTGTVPYNYGASQGVPDDQNLKWTNGGAASCNTTYCHSNGQGGNGVAVDWATTVSSGNCNKCHADAAAAGSLSGRHANHLASTTLAAVTFTCAVCHGNTAAGNATISNKANHVNKVKDVVFGPYSGSYNLGASACLNTYCHSNGSTTRMPQHPALSWNVGTIPANCAGCHGNAVTSGGAGSALSGKHRAHLNNYTTLGRGNDFGCNDCHIKTATNNTTIGDRTRHINQLKDYSGARAGRIVAAGECASNYCHSSGQATPVYRNMTGTKRWTGSATFGCGGCHGLGSTLGAPNYPNGGAGAASANSHAKHVEAIGVIDSTQCADCHAKTVDPAIAGKFKDYTGALYHLNRQRDVVFQPVAGLTGVLESNKTCSNTYCHGTSSGVAWGATGLDCANCHNASNSAGSQLAGAHSIHYAATVLPTKFINVSGNVSSASAYRFTCSSCHASGTNMTQHARGPANVNGHAQVFYGLTTAGRAGNAYDYAGTTAGTDRGFKWTDGGSASCITTYCHSNGQGSNGAIAVSWNMTASGASCEKCHTIAGLTARHAKHIGAAEYNFGCATCHGATVSDNSTIGDKSRHVNKVKDVVISTTYGGAYSGGTCQNVYCHSDGKATPAYVNQAWSGVTGCRSCHGDAVSNGGAGSPLSGAHASHVNNAAVIGSNFACADCHALTLSSNTTISDKSKHVNKLRDVSFTAPYGGSGACATYCHTNGRGGAPNVTVTWTGAAINCNGCHNSLMTSGSHAKHISSQTDCAKCHRLTTSTGTAIIAGATHLNGVRDVRFATFAGYTGAFNGTNCTSTYCHGSTTPTPAWVGGTTTCSSCHGTVGLPGGHAIHVGATQPTSFTTTPANISSSGIYGFTCSSCHLAGTSKAQHAMGPAGAFGDAQVFFGLTTNTRKGTYTAGTASTTDGMGFKWTGDGAGCATGYCHSDGKGVNGSSAIAWSTAVPSGASCEKCHTTPLLSGRHAVHISVTDYNFACAVCHGATISSGSIAISDKAMHVNKVKNVAINNFYGGTYNGGGTCQNVYCHSNAAPFGGTNVFRAPAWTSTVGCTGCHAQGSGAPGDTNLSFGHNKHLSLTTYAFTCDRCHAQSVNPSNGVIPGGLHVNKVKDVRFGHFTAAASFGNISGLYNATARTCASTYCHSDGQTTPALTTTIAWGGTLAANCTGCHGYAGTAGAAGTTPSRRHSNHTSPGGYNYNCSRCHISTTTSGSTITNFGQHVNGVRDVSFAVYSTATDSILRGTWEGTACKNVYCHGDGQHNNYNDASKDRGWTEPAGLAGTCNYCHQTPLLISSGSHAPHRTAGTECDTCHHLTMGGSGLVSNKAVHADQRATIQFATEPNGTYNGIAAGGSNVSAKLVTATPSPATCGTTSCHGSASPVWGRNTTAHTCTKCHGTLTTATSVTNAQMAPATGAHQVHVRGAGTQNLSRTLTCWECHQTGTSITFTNHMNGTGDVTFTNASTALDNATPSAGAWSGTGTKTCSVYCHGVKMPKGDTSGTAKTPVWTNASLMTGVASNDCRLCHGNPPTTGTTTGTHASYVSQPTTSCNGCHNHFTTAGGFASEADRRLHINGIVEASGSCISCHSVTKGIRAAVTTEFGLAWGHKKAGRTPVTDSDCIVCHLEGDFTSQGQSGVHGDGKIDLRDPDGAGETAITNNSGAAFTFTQYAISYAAGSRTTTLGNTIPEVITNKFCLKCHDANGATNPMARTRNATNTLTTGTQYSPFEGINIGANYTTVNGAAAANGLIDVAKQFASTNSSRHPVGAPNNRAYPYSNRLAAPYNNIGTTRDANTQTNNSASPRVKANSVILVCDDCHTTGTSLTTRTITAHGGASSLRGTFSITNGTLCVACHIANGTSSYPNTATTAPGGSHGVGSAFRSAAAGDETRAAPAMNRCQFCHGSNPNTYTAASRPRFAQDFHGFNEIYNTNAGWTSGSANGMRPIAFMRNSSWPAGFSPRPYVATVTGPGQFNLTAGQSQCGGSFAFAGGNSGVSCSSDGHTGYYPGGSY